MKLTDKIDIAEIQRTVDESGNNTRIYIGCDSERVNRKGVWFADYFLAAVVHLNGKHGARIFGSVVKEIDYDQRRDKPSLRLMNEVYKVSELYLRLADVVDSDIIEVHLDLNPSDKFASNHVVQQAIGYIKGTCNVTPLVKPRAFAASYAADRLKEVYEMRG